MPRPKIYASAAERQKAYRESNELKTLTVELPADLLAEFDAYLQFKDVTKRAVIEKLLRTQLLRKR